MGFLDEKCAEIVTIGEKLARSSLLAKHSVTTPMGSDRVFLYCTGGENVWNVFNEAVHFFGMLISNVKKWSFEDVINERGAWIRVYGTLIHA